MNTPNAVTVLLPDGSTEQQIIDSFVNARSAAIEAARPAPPLYKARLVPVIVSSDECVRIDGKSYIKRSARDRIGNAAGVQQFGEPRVEEFEREGKAMTRVTVALVRPPVYPEPLYGMAEGAISDAKNAKERQFFLAKLATQAHTRALKKVLADDFSYDPQEISRNEGRFLVASVTPDETDPDVRQIHLERMRQASNQLYAPKPQPVAPSLPPPDILDDDVFDPAEIRHAEPEQLAEPEMPTWCKSFARDPLSGAINWESLQAEEVESVVRKAIKSEQYPLEDDPGGVVEQCKAGDWVAAASALYEWQMGGGADA